MRVLESSKKTYIPVAPVSPVEPMAPVGPAISKMLSVTLWWPQCFPLLSTHVTTYYVVKQDASDQSLSRLQMQTPRKDRKERCTMRRYVGWRDTPVGPVSPVKPVAPGDPVNPARPRETISFNVFVSCTIMVNDFEIDECDVHCHSSHCNGCKPPANAKNDSFRLQNEVVCKQLSERAARHTCRSGGSGGS